MILSIKKMQMVARFSRRPPVAYHWAIPQKWGQCDQFFKILFCSQIRYHFKGHKLKYEKITKNEPEF